MPAPDATMYLYRHRTATQALLNTPMKSFCFRYLIPKASPKNYLYLLDFILQARTMDIDSSMGYVIGSVGLDLTSQGDEQGFDTRITNIEHLVSFMIGGSTPANTVPMTLVKYSNHLATVPDAEMSPEEKNIKAIVKATTGDADSWDAAVRAIIQHANTEIPVEDRMLFPGHKGEAMMVASIVSLCNRGSMTDHCLRKICDGIKTPTQLSDVLDRQSAAGCFDMLKAKFAVGRPVGELFATLKDVFPESVNLRLHLVLDQAEFQGCAPIRIAIDAMKMSTVAPLWAWLKQNVEAEWIAFCAAASHMKENPYAGFELGAKSDPVLHSTKFPAIAYAGIGMQKALSAVSTVKGYRGTPVTHHSITIDTMILAYIQSLQQSVAAACLTPVQWTADLPGFDMVIAPVQGPPANQ